MSGRSVDDYEAPLFVAWQLTNGCDCACLACCEGSGVGRHWPDELTRSEALDLVRQIVEFGIPYVAFGGGEPLMVPHVWDILERLAAAGVAIKIETNGHQIDRAAAARLCAFGVECVQISLDGATAATHERVRPGGDFAKAIAAVEHIVEYGTAPQWVFAPTRLNIAEIMPAFDLAVRHGCDAFVTGPLMRLGRAAAASDRLACDEAVWRAAAERLRARAAEAGGATALSIYSWDIVTEVEVRLDSPQAMLLVVPNGRVKLLNALPFAAADLRRQTLAQAWDAYRAAWRTPEVGEFARRCRGEPDLLRHANEVWPLPLR